MILILTRLVVGALLLALASAACAQPILSSLWPLDVGREWEFDARVEGASTGTQTGSYIVTVMGQNEMSSGLMAACFAVRNTLSPSETPSSMEARMASVFVSSRLLINWLPPTCALGMGVVVDEEVALGFWSEPIGWGWWWVPADPAPGATFSFPVPPPPSSGGTLNGEVRTITGVVTTPGGLFTNAVIVDYVFEMPEAEISDAGVGVIGTVSVETTGWIAFVPEVGPVASEETTTYTEIDCPECPASLFDPYTMTLELRATVPVPTEHLSVSSLKARF